MITEWYGGFGSASYVYGGSVGVREGEGHRCLSAEGF